MNRRYLPIGLIAAIVLFTGSPGPAQTTNAHPKADWLIMVYLDADNNLDPFGIKDVKEMEEAGASDSVKIAVLMDRYEDEDWETTRRFLVQPKSQLGEDRHSWDPELSTCEDLGELNMGDPKTLTDFLTWAIEKYPAEKRMLIFWNHGGGWRDVFARAVGKSLGTRDVSPERVSHSPFSRGIAWDDTNGHDFLEMREVRTALESTPKLDIIGMDACLMAMLEVAYEIREQADFLVASEDLEPGDGWPYTTLLAPLLEDSTMEPEQLCRITVQAYAEDYAKMEMPVTLSAVRLTKMDALAKEMDLLGRSMKSAYASSDDDRRVSFKDFDVPAFPTYSREFVVLDAVMEKLQEGSDHFDDEKVKEQAGKTRDVLSSVIVTNHTSGKLGGRGLTVFSGVGGDSDEYTAEIIEFARDTQWDELLVAMKTGEKEPEETVEEEPHERFAVLIGVGKYDDPKIPSLAYPENDIDRLREVLVRHAGYDPDKVHVMKNKEVTAAKLRSTLGTWLPRQAGERDLVLIYFSGHGGAEPALHEGMDDGMDKYMMLSDSRLEDMYGTAFPMSELARIFARIRSDKLLLMMDACYSGASGGRGVIRPGMKSVGLSDSYLNHLTDSAGTVVLTASKASEISMESPEYEQGIFTFRLCEALSGKADTNNDDVISLAETYSYLSDHVTADAKKMGALQHPVLRGEFTGRFPLAVREPVSAEEPKEIMTEAKQPETTQAVTPPPPAEIPEEKAPPQPTLKVQQTDVTRGSRIVVKYSDLVPKNASAWIAFYRSDANHRDYIEYTFLNNLTDNTYDVIAPREPGEYLFKIFPDKGYEPAAVSEPVTVK